LGCRGPWIRLAQKVFSCVPEGIKLRAGMACFQLLAVQRV